MTDKHRILFYDLENYVIDIDELGYVMVTSKHKRNKGNKLAQWKNLDGYLMTKMDCKSISIHALVCLCTYGSRPNGFVINHKDGNKLNNHPNNLEYCTIAENIKHAIDNGLHVSGTPERHGKYIDGRSWDKKLYQRKYYEDNIEKYKERGRAFYQKNRDEILARLRTKRGVS